MAVNAAIGLQWQRLPLALVLAAAAGAGLALLALRDMPLALTLFVVSAATVSFSLGTGTKSNLNTAMLMVGLFSGVWLLRMLVTRRFRLVRTPLNRPLARVPGRGRGVVDLRAGHRRAAGRACASPA